ncbi:hypothetical protein DSO57_1009413 [Entomophthora muscae]|uniref:Uncharacterized protein n=1 Tax=Entomophthora muscae TaxID=34485 RepID=A0ACC2U5D2_9FUNG|nr:hypothetical protein DSO57_1009413 [Entomophthora muscae]
MKMRKNTTDTVPSQDFLSQSTATSMMNSHAQAQAKVPGSLPSLSVPLQDLNPNTLQAASPHDQLPGRPQIYGLKLEQDLTSENLLRLEKQKLLASRPPTPQVPVNLTNESAGQAKNPEITWATAAGEAEKLPMECRPPKDDKPHNLKGNFELSQFEPANEITPTMDTAKGFKSLVDSSTRSKGICKSFSMADGYNYTLGFLFHLQTNFCGSVPPIYSLQETADQLPKLYHLLEAPFGPVNFTEYPPNLAYLDFTLEEILIHNPEARTSETETVYREGIKVTISPLLFHDKYSYLPAYLVLMTPPLTLQPNRPQESVTANESTSTQIFGVMYITLTGLIDSMVPVSRLWALMGKSISYIVNLAPILWWALPAGPVGCLPASSQEPPTGWFPDTRADNIKYSVW